MLMLRFYETSSPWLLSHLRTTLCMGHAVDSPLPSVSWYMREQHR